MWLNGQLPTYCSQSTWGLLRTVKFQPKILDLNPESLLLKITPQMQKKKSSCTKMVITALLIIEKKKMIAKRKKKKPPQKLSNIRNRAGWLNHYRSQKFTKTTQ